MKPKAISRREMASRDATCKAAKLIRKGAKISAAWRAICHDYGRPGSEALRRRWNDWFWTYHPNSWATRFRCSEDSQEERRGRRAWVLAFTRHMARYPKARASDVWWRITGLGIHWLHLFSKDEARAAAADEEAVRAASAKEEAARLAKRKADRAARRPQTVDDRARSIFRRGFGDELERSAS